MDIGTVVIIICTLINIYICVTSKYEIKIKKKQQTNIRRVHIHRLPNGRRRVVRQPPGL